MENGENEILKREINNKIDKLLAAQDMSEEEKVSVLKEALLIIENEKKDVQ